MGGWGVGISGYTKNPGNLQHDVLAQRHNPIQSAPTKTRAGKKTESASKANAVKEASKRSSNM